MNDINALKEYVVELTDKNEKAQFKAMVACLQLSEAFAKRNITKNFTGRNGRRLSGGLLNSVYVNYKMEGKTMTGQLGVKNIPYGAIHEFGGTITPKNAKHLWIPRYVNSKKMTPMEFMALKKGNPRDYFLNDKVAGKVLNKNRKKNERAKIIPLFMLVDKVQMPARPYLAPAMEDAFDNYGDYYQKFLGE